MKYLLYSLLGLVLGLVALGFFVPLVLDINQYKEHFSDYIKKKTGFDVVLLGNLDLKVFPSPKIQISDVNITQNLNNEKQKVASIHEMIASFDLSSLVYAKFKIKSMKFDGLNIYMDSEKSLNNHLNLQNYFNQNKNYIEKEDNFTRENQPEEPLFSVEIDKITFVDSTFKYFKKNKNYEIYIEEIDIYSSYMNTYILNGSVYLDKERFNIETLLTIEDEKVPLRGKVSSKYGSINLQGDLSRDFKSFDIEIDYNLKSMQSIFLTELDSNNTKDISLYFKSYLKGSYSDHTELKFNNMLFRIGENEITGAFEMIHLDKTKFHGAFSSNLLDLNFLTTIMSNKINKEHQPIESSNKESEPVTNIDKGSVQPINIDFLNNIEGTLLFTSGVLEINDIPIKDALLDVKFNEEDILINNISGLFPGRTKLNAQLNITKNQDFDGYVNLNSGSFRTFLDTIGLNLQSIKSDKFHVFEFDGKLNGNLNSSFNNQFSSTLDNLSIAGNINFIRSVNNPNLILDLNIDNLNFDNYWNKRKSLESEEQSLDINREENINESSVTVTWKDYNKNLLNFNNSKDLNIDIIAKINNLKLNNISYETIDIKANHKNKRLLVDHIKIFHSDQSFINIAGNIDQNISSKKQHFDFFAKFSTLNLTNTLKAYGFKKELSDLILPIPLHGEVLINGGNQELKIKLDTNLFEGKLTTEGILSLKDNKPIRYDGSFGIKHSNFGVFLSNFNVQNFNPLPFNLSGNIRFTENDFISESLFLENGSNILKGYFSYQKTEEEKPYVSIQINSDLLNFSFLTDTNINEKNIDGDGETSDNTLINSNTKVNENKKGNKFISILNSYNGELDLYINKYIFPKGILEDLELKATLDEGILEFEKADLVCFGGKVSTVGKIDVLSSPYIAISGNFNKINTKEVLSLLDLHFLNGELNSDFNFIVKNLGDKNLLQNLDGNFNLLNSNGSINGINIGYLSEQNIHISNPEDILDISKNVFTGSTILDSLTASAMISGGVATLEDANLIFLNGKGQIGGIIDLNKESLNLNITLRSLAESYPPLAFDVKGSWNEPSASFNDETAKLLYAHFGKRMILEQLEEIKKDGADSLFNEVLEGVLEGLSTSSDQTQDNLKSKEDNKKNEDAKNNLDKRQQEDLILNNIENAEDILDGIIKDILKK